MDRVDAPGGSDLDGERSRCRCFCARTGTLCIPFEEGVSFSPKNMFQQALLLDLFFLLPLGLAEDRLFIEALPGTVIR